jgi:hypothetical protein
MELRYFLGISGVIAITIYQTLAAIIGGGI